MWCPVCKTEYNENETSCPDCGALLVPELGPPVLEWGRTRRWELAETWPKNEQGEPERPAFLGRFSSVDLADEMTANMLEAFGVPSFRRYPGDGAFGRVMLGMSGLGTDLYVPESLLEDALALLENRQIEEEDDVL